MRRIVAGLAAFALLGGVGVARAQGPARIAVDSADARRLVEHWLGSPGDTLACLYGRRIALAEGPAFDVDSVAYAVGCGGRGVIGELGFRRPREEESDLVLAAMQRVLDVRPDLDIAGVVIGIEPTRDDQGQVVRMPRVWAAWRLVRPADRARSRRRRRREPARRRGPPAAPAPPHLPRTMDRRGSPQGRLLLRPRGAR